MATISGQTTVTTAGTAVKLSSTVYANGSVMVKALAGNTGFIYIGNVSEDVSSSNGLELDAGEAVVFEHLDDLGYIWIDSSVNGEGVSWLVLHN